MADGVGLAAPKVEDRGHRRILWIELAVVSCIYWLPATVYSAMDFAGLFPGHNRSHALISTADLWVDFLHSLSYIVVTLFILWASGDALFNFGLGLKKSLLLLLAIPTFVLDRLVHWIGLNQTRAPAAVPDLATYVLLVGGRYGSYSVGHTVAFISATTASAFIQELYFRGYLITRFKNLTGNVAIAVFIPMIIFGSMHLYEGVPSMITVTASGAVYTGIFLLTESIWPGVIVHAAMNLALGFATLGRYVL